jgi:tRNA wybutosine-synthesizing protein 2
MQVREVPKDKLVEVSTANWVDRTRRPYIEGNIAWVPVIHGEAYDRDISHTPAYTGRGYYMMGDVAVIHGKRPDTDAIRKIAEFCKPRGIIWREALEDVTRTPRSEIVWGECGEVRHRENGYTYILDPSKVMFSQGNRREKTRIAQQIQTGTGSERIADMFAGVGYFTIPMAGAGATVHAMEINPVSCGYLQRNAAENKLDNRITISPGDCRDNISGNYDRIIMGHFDALEMLPDALLHVKPGSIIHLHSIGPHEEEIRRITEGAGFSCGIIVHKVKKYCPHAWHVVHDVTIA